MLPTSPHQGPATGLTPSTSFYGMKRTTSTTSVRSLAPPTLAHTPSSIAPPAPTPIMMSPTAVAPAAPIAAPSALSSGATPAAAPSGSHPGVLSPLQPLVKLPEKIPICQLPRVYIANQNGLVVGVSAHLPPTAQASMLEYIDLFTMNVLSYSNQWYYIMAALSLDYTCVLVNLFVADFFVAVEDIGSALQCLKRAKALLGNDYPIPAIHTVQIQGNRITNGSIASVNTNASNANKNGPMTAIVDQFESTNSMQNNGEKLVSSQNSTHSPFLMINTNPINPATDTLIPTTTVTKREVLYYHAYNSWLTGNMSQALSYFLTISCLYPSDIFAAKRAQLLAFLLGNQAVMINVLLVPTMVDYISQLHANYWHSLKLSSETFWASKQPQTTPSSSSSSSLSLLSTQSLALSLSTKDYDTNPHSSSTNTQNLNTKNQPTSLPVSNTTTTLSLQPPQLQADPWVSSLLHLLHTIPNAQLLGNLASNTGFVRTKQPWVPNTKSQTQSNTPSSPIYYQPSLHSYQHTFTQLSYYFGMLSFALEQTGSYIHALHSGYLGTLISLVQHHFYKLSSNVIQIQSNTTTSHLTTIYNGVALKTDDVHISNIGNDVNNTNAVSTHQTTGNKLKQIHKIYQDPWSHHGLFHALFSLSEHSLAIPLALSLAPQWDGAMSFMFTHNWFHIALMLIERASFVAALAILDTCLWKFDIEGSVKGEFTHNDNDKRQVFVWDKNAQKNSNQNDLNNDTTCAQTDHPSSNSNLRLSKDWNHNIFAREGTCDQFRTLLTGINTKQTIQSNFVHGSSSYDQNNQNNSQNGENYQTNNKYWIYLGEGCVDLNSEEIELVDTISPSSSSSSSSSPFKNNNVSSQSGFYFLLTPSSIINSDNIPFHDYNGRDKMGHVAEECGQYSLFNYYHYQPTWNVYQFLQLLGYKHDDVFANPNLLKQSDIFGHPNHPNHSPQVPSAGNDHPLHLYYGPQLDSTLHDSQTFLGLQQQQQLQHQLQHQLPSQSSSQFPSTALTPHNSPQNVHIVPPLEHDHYLKLTVPSPWKKYDVNYPITAQQQHLSLLHEHATGNNNVQQIDTNPELFSSLQLYNNFLQEQYHSNGFQYNAAHYDMLKQTMPLVNKANTQDQAGALGLLWKLELHALCETGLLCHRNSQGDCATGVKDGGLGDLANSGDNVNNMNNNMNNNNMNNNIQTKLSPQTNPNNKPQTSCHHCTNNKSGLVLLEIETNNIIPIHSPYQSTSSSPDNTSQLDKPSSSPTVLIPCSDPLLTFPIIPSLNHRFNQVLSYVNLNNTHQDPFFDILVAAALARARRIEELEFYIEQCAQTVMSLPPPRREQMQSTFLPLLHSLYAFSNLSYKQAAQCLIPIFIKGVGVSNGSSVNPSTHLTTTANTAETLSTGSTSPQSQANGQIQSSRSRKQRTRRINASGGQTRKTVTKKNSSGVTTTTLASNLATSTTNNFDIVRLLTLFQHSVSQNISVNIFTKCSPFITLFLTFLEQTSMNRRNAVIEQEQEQQQQQQQQQQSQDDNSISTTNKKNHTKNPTLVSNEVLAPTPNQSSSIKSPLKPLSPFTELLRVQQYLQRCQNDAPSNTAVNNQPTNTKLLSNTASPSNSSPSPAHTNTSYASNTSNTSNTSSPFSSLFQYQTGISLELERLACLGGSNEQRDVFTDYFCIVLFVAQEHFLLIKVLDIILDGRESIWLRKLRAQTLSAMVLREKDYIQYQAKLAKL
jgi:hypothetical protein